MRSAQEQVKLKFRYAQTNLTESRICTRTSEIDGELANVAPLVDVGVKSTKEKVKHERQRV